VKRVVGLALDLLCERFPVREAAPERVAVAI
jgi:hypothetical protein